MRDEQLRCFLSAARHQNFLRAARECHMSQPTVSRQIATLEQEIGTPLFYRNGKRLSLTPAGKYLSNMIQSYLDQCDRLMAECRRIGARTNTAIRILTGVWEDFLLTEPLSRFVRQTTPPREFNCISKSYGAMSSKLYLGEMDLGFCIEECALQARSDLTITPIYRKNWLVAAAPAHDFWTLPLDKRSWLEGQTVILGNFWLESSTAVLGQSEELGPFEPECLHRGLRQKGVIHGGTLYGQLAMARAGYGVLILPPWLPDYLLEGLRAEDCLTEPYAPTIVLAENPHLQHPHLPLLKKLCLEHFEALGGLE